MTIFIKMLFMMNAEYGIEEDYLWILNIYIYSI